MKDFLLGTKSDFMNSPDLFPDIYSNLRVNNQVRKFHS